MSGINLLNQFQNYWPLAAFNSGASLLGEYAVGTATIGFAQFSFNTDGAIVGSADGVPVSPLSGPTSIFPFVGAADASAFEISLNVVSLTRTSGGLTFFAGVPLVSVGATPWYSLSTPRVVRVEVPFSASGGVARIIGDVQVRNRFTLQQVTKTLDIYIEK